MRSIFESCVLLQLGPYTLFSRDWFDMVESLQHLTNIALMEQMLPKAQPNATLWERDELTVRFLLEEGKLNLCLRLLVEFKKHMTTNTPNSVLVQASVGPFLKTIFWSEKMRSGSRSSHRLEEIKPSARHFRAKHGPFAPLPAQAEILTSGVAAKLRLQKRGKSPDNRHAPVDLALLNDAEICPGRPRGFFFF